MQAAIRWLKVFSLLTFCGALVVISWALARIAVGGPLTVIDPAPTPTELITIVLTAVTVVLAILAFAVAVLAFWGYGEIISIAKRAAEDKAHTEMPNLVASRLDPIVAIFEDLRKAAEQNSYAAAYAEPKSTGEGDAPLAKDYPEDAGEK